MTDDIVTRLRKRANRCPFAESPLVLEAADEIERLRIEVTNLLAWVSILQERGNK